MNTRFYGILALLAVGLLLDGGLIWHLSAVGQDAGLPGCSLSGLSCDEVLNSPYGRVLGISLAWWGAVYHFILIVTVLVATRLPQIPARLMVAVAAIPGATAAVWLVIVMKTQIGSFCLWCLAVHAVNLTLLLTAVYQAQVAWDRDKGTKWGEPPSSRGLLIAGAFTGCALAAWQIAMLALFHDPIQLVVEPVAGKPSPLSELSVTVDPQPLITMLGDPQSSRRIVVFSCLTCRECRKVHRMLAAIQHKASPSLRIELRFAPLSPECNPAHTAVKKTSVEHRNACQLAHLALAVAASRPSQFAGYVEWLFERQHNLPISAAQAEAERRCGAGALNAALDGLAVNERLAHDVELAQLFQVVSVPQIFVKDGRLSGTVSTVTLQAALADL